ncbi:response regulator [Alginatibacterium sediminis]|uniref:Response regulator n=1 Tax=Alginatibacterium sediminis TaxID=2164068 RepID=A0A420E5Z2_9ALTE|nr:response regulator [Alginatibacterium sediminis]RKF13130.1 response regulator [Alginatibacterium sediminis]
MNLLLVDDDRELSELLSELLELEGYHTEICNNGERALERLKEKSYDLVLLDVMMPEKNGFDVLRELRVSNQQPVLMLTAKGDEFDRVLGLELGADDYLAKPFSERELLARIRAILRRTAKQDSSSKSDNIIEQHDVHIDIGTQQALCQEQLLDLTSTEFLLLQQLISHPGEVIDKNELSQSVLGKRLQAFDRSLDMHLSNLRRKIPERVDGHPRIKTVRGKGYMWLLWS